MQGKEKLIECAVNAAIEKYGNRIHSAIQKRIDDELAIITKSDSACKEFLKAMHIAEKYRDNNILYSVDGAAGSSFIAYLLGITYVNPLMPHYYCPKCKRVTFISHRRLLSGYDLQLLGGKAKVIESEWETDCFDNSKFLFEYETDETIPPARCPLCAEKRTYDGHAIPWEAFFGPCGEKEISFEFHNDEEDPFLHTLSLMQGYTGIAASEINIDDIDICNFLQVDSFRGIKPCDGIIDEIQAAIIPETFGDVIKMAGLYAGIGTWEGNAKYLIENIEKGSDDFTDLISCAEDISATLIKGKLPRAEAFSPVEFMVNGLADKIQGIRVPSWYQASLEKIEHLPHKAAVVQYVLNCFRKAWYKINHPDAFYAALLTANYSFNFCYDRIINSPLCFWRTLSEMDEDLEKNIICQLTHTPEEKILKLVSECHQECIQFDIASPDVADLRKFTPAGKSIILPKIASYEKNENNERHNFKTMDNIIKDLPAPQSIKKLWDIIDFSAGNIYIIGGRPAMGKTTLMMNMALIFAEKNIPVHIFTFDLSKAELAKRWITLHSYKQAASPCLPIEICDSAQAITDMPLIIKNELLDNSMGVIFVDYLQKLESPFLSPGNALVLKQIATDFNVPVIALSQLSRNVEKRRDKRPLLRDLACSSQLNYMSSATILIYRNGYYNIDSEPLGKCAELIIAKNTDGATGTLTVPWNIKTNSFE